MPSLLLRPSCLMPSLSLMLSCLMTSLPLMLSCLMASLPLMLSCLMTQLAAYAFLPDAQLATNTFLLNAQHAADAFQLDDQLAADSPLLDAQPDCDAPVLSSSNGFMPAAQLVFITRSKLPDPGGGAHVPLTDLGGMPPSGLKDSGLKSAKKSADTEGKLFKTFPHPRGLSGKGQNGAFGGHSLRGGLCYCLGHLLVALPALHQACTGHRD